MKLFLDYTDLRQLLISKKTMKKNMSTDYLYLHLHRVKKKHNFSSG